MHYIQLQSPFQKKKKEKRLQSERIMSLNLNLNPHSLDPQLPNLYARPHGPVVRQHALEVRRHHVKGLRHIDMVAAHGIDILPRESGVDGTEDVLDILKGEGDLSLDVRGDAAVLCPAALAGSLDNVADFNGLRVVEGFGVGFGAGVVVEGEV